MKDHELYEKLSQADRVEYKIEMIRIGQMTDLSGLRELFGFVMLGIMLLNIGLGRYVPALVNLGVMALIHCVCLIGEAVIFSGYKNRLRLLISKQIEDNENGARKRK